MIDTCTAPKCIKEGLYGSRPVLCWDHYQKSLKKKNPVDTFLNISLFVIAGTYLSLGVFGMTALAWGSEGTFWI